MQFLWICAILFPIIFMVVKLKTDRPIGTVFKGIASLFFVLPALVQTAGAENVTAFSVLLTIGLFFGLCGDVFLDLQDPNTGKNPQFLYLGISAFACQHLLTVIACTLHPGNTASGWALIISLIVGAGMGLSMGYSEKKMLGFDFKNAFAISTVYASILASAFVYYFILLILNKIFAPFFIAMILFLLSDLVLSVMYYNEKNKNPYLLILNLSTYYAAQIIFALNVTIA